MFMLLNSAKGDTIHLSGHSNAIIRKEENTDFNFKVFLDGVLFVYKKFKSITIL